MTHFFSFFIMVIFINPTYLFASFLCNLKYQKDNPNCLYQEFKKHESNFEMGKFSNSIFYEAIKIGIKKQDYSLLSWSIKNYKVMVGNEDRKYTHYSLVSYENAQWILFLHIYHLEKIIYSYQIPIKIHDQLRELKLYFIEKYQHSLSYKHFFFTNPKIPYLRVDFHMISALNLDKGKSMGKVNNYDFILIPSFFIAAAQKDFPMVEFLLNHHPSYIYKQFQNQNILEFMDNYISKDKSRERYRMISFLLSKGARDLPKNGNYDRMRYVQFNDLHPQYDSSSSE